MTKLACNGQHLRIAFPVKHANIRNIQSSNDASLNDYLPSYSGSLRLHATSLIGGYKYNLQPLFLGPSSSVIKVTVTKIKTRKQAGLRKSVIMAPGLVDPPQTEPAVAKGPVGPKEAFIGGPQVFNRIAEEQGTEKQPPATHPKYLPVWDADTKCVPDCLRQWSWHDQLTYSHRFPPLEPFPHYEHGQDADPSFPELFRGTSVTELTPSIGSEVSGIQLSALILSFTP